MNRYALPLAAALVVVIGAAYLLFRPSTNIGPQPTKAPPSASPAQASLVGTWEVTPTSDNLRARGVIGHIATDPDEYGHFRLTFTDDQWQVVHLSAAPYATAPESYTADADVIHMVGPDGMTYNSKFTVTDTNLDFDGQGPTWLWVLPWTRASTEPFAPAVARPLELISGDVGRSLTPGTYRVRSFAAEFALALPAGWMLTELAQGTAGFALQGTNSNVAFFVVDGVVSDPCHPDKQRRSIGSGVQQLVDGLSSITGFEVSDVTDVTVGGARGKAFQFKNTVDTGSAGCAANPMPFATMDRDGDGKDVDINMFGGETDRFWALDVSGTTVLVAITDTPAITADTRPVFNSLVFGDGSGH